MRPLAWFVVLSLLQGGATQRPAGVRVGFTVTPDTVVVGEPTILRVRVEAPAGSRLIFPPAIDSTANVEPLDPVSVQEESKNGVVDVVATYRFLTWQVGVSEIPLAAVRLERDGQTQDIAIGTPTVFARSVLPADTAQRAPKPARDIIWLPISKWPWWLLVLVGFAIAGIIGWLLQRRADRAATPIEPFVDAQRAFGRLSSLDLIGAGEPAKHVSAAADILRAFLVARNAGAGAGLTTAELVGQLRKDARVPAARVTAMLTAADNVKFAGDDIDAPRAEALGSEAEAVVAVIHKSDLQKVAAE